MSAWTPRTARTASSKSSTSPKENEKDASTSPAAPRDPGASLNGNHVADRCTACFAASLRPRAKTSRSGTTASPSDAPCLSPVARAWRSSCNDTTQHPPAKSSGASRRNAKQNSLPASHVGSDVARLAVVSCAWSSAPCVASMRPHQTRATGSGVPARYRAPSTRATNLGPYCFEVRNTFGDAGCCWRSTVGDAVCWRGGTASSTKGAKGAGMGGLARASLERSITAARALLPGACWRNCFFRQPRVDDRPRAAACRSQKALPPCPFADRG